MVFVKIRLNKTTTPYSTIELGLTFFVQFCCYFTYVVLSYITKMQ